MLNPHDVSRWNVVSRQGLEEVWTVRPLQVGLVEVERLPLLDRSGVNPSRGSVKVRERIAGLGQILEHRFAAGDHRRLVRRHDIDAEGEEERTVGIDQPPLAVLLHRAEEPCGLLLGPVSPAAEAVAVGGSGMGLEVGRLELVTVHQVRFGLDLAGPVGPGILAERVDDAVERNRQAPAWPRGPPDDAPPWAGGEDLERHDMLKVKRP